MTHPNDDERDTQMLLGLMSKFFNHDYKNDLTMFRYFFNQLEISDPELLHTKEEILQRIAYQKELIQLYSDLYGLVSGNAVLRIEPVDGNIIFTSIIRSKLPKDLTNDMEVQTDFPPSFAIHCDIGLACLNGVVANRHAGWHVQELL